jgi:hypothetical protein
MPVYISMLRAINVGSHNRMPMDRLRASCEALRFNQVRTYVHRGNGIFRAARGSPADLSKKIEARILKDFGFSVPVISKTSIEMGKAIPNNPFLRKSGVDPSKLPVTFLSQMPPRAACRRWTHGRRSRMSFVWAQKSISIAPMVTGEPSYPTSFRESAVHPRHHPQLENGEQTLPDFLGT